MKINFGLKNLTQWSSPEFIFDIISRTSAKNGIRSLQIGAESRIQL